MPLCVCEYIEWFIFRLNAEMNTDTFTVETEIRSVQYHHSIITSLSEASPSEPALFPQTLQDPKRRGGEFGKSVFITEGWKRWRLDCTGEAFQYGLLTKGRTLF